MTTDESNKIFRKSTGQFRVLLTSIKLNEYKIEENIIKINNFVREHPYFQLSHDLISLYLPHANSCDELSDSLGYLGREVIGTELEMAKDFGIMVANGSRFQYLSKSILFNYDFSAKELYQKYKLLKDELSDFEMGPFWRFEFKLADKFAGEIHILPLEENLFSQFGEYC